MARKSFGVMLAFLLMGTLAVAADFSGTWIRDAAKSDPMGMGRGGPGGGGGGGGQPPSMEVTLTVKHSGNDLAVTRRVVREGQDPRVTEQKFTLDGQDSKTVGSMGRGEMVAKAKLDGDKINIAGVQKMSTQQGDFEIKIQEVWELSADGKLLTITTNSSTPMGERASKQVYAKQ